MRKTCCDIKVKEWNSDNKVDILLSKLKLLFAKDYNQVAFLAYHKFEMFQRPPNMNTVDFIKKFERLYNNIKRYDKELSMVVIP